MEILKIGLRSVLSWSSVGQEPTFQNFMMLRILVTEETLGGVFLYAPLNGLKQANTDQCNGIK